MPLNPSLGKKIRHPSRFFTPPRLTCKQMSAARLEAPPQPCVIVGNKLSSHIPFEYPNTFFCDIFVTVLRDIFEHLVGEAMLAFRSFAPS